MTVAVEDEWKTEKCNQDSTRKTAGFSCEWPNVWCEAVMRGKECITQCTLLFPSDRQCCKEIDHGSKWLAPTFLSMVAMIYVLDSTQTTALSMSDHSLRASEWLIHTYCCSLPVSGKLVVPPTVTEKASLTFFTTVFSDRQCHHHLCQYVSRNKVINASLSSISGLLLTHQNCHL